MRTEPVAVRPGATVLVVRDAPEPPRGIEVLLLRRTPDAVFLPGAHCFPGGRVEPTDGEDPARGAALREAFEEAGLLLGTGRVDDGFDTEAWRAAVYDGTATLDDAAAAAGLVLDPESLRFLARWVTPPGGPRRFDARFFVAPAPVGQEPACDGTELVECAWWRPSRALAANAAGEILVIQPTEQSLRVLDRFPTVAALLAALDAADPDDRVEEAPESWRVRLPFDRLGARA
jgi:8-oxo-dGTP pyrophosphatase MutT (NUDIX family)